MARGFILSGIILASLFQAVFLSENNKCPHIIVQKDQIIRTKESLDNGAKYLAKKSVNSARECHSLCCERDNCNLAMLSYKNDSYGQLVRSCYLFDCGQPSRCTFSPYKHYATIVIEDREVDNKPTRNEENLEHEDTKLPSKSRGTERFDEDCPPGVPVAMCYSNPCDKATCPSHPWAVCKASFCGSCHAVFVDDDDGTIVDCYSHRKKTKPSHSTNSKWTDTLLNEIDRLHHKSAHTHPTNDEKTDLESGLNHFTKHKQASHKSTSTSTSVNSNHEETDPPFHQWREFIDNNPKFGKPRLVTEKPTPKPTTFHQWREFIDNNPKYSKRPVLLKTTAKPTTKATPAKKPTTKKQIIHKTAPVTEIHPLQTSPPKVINDANRSNNISDVVVIETSNLRIVENKAVVPLAIFLVVSLVLLIVVVLRLRVMKSRLRRKAFATDDADYLINGMYL